MTLRNIKPLTIPDVKSADIHSALPRFEWIDPKALLVDEAYQRNLSERSAKLIAKIVSGWDWARFKPPVVVEVEGALHVIDGQHTAIGAVTHGGIPQIPVMVVEALEAQDRARAFVGHNKDRLTVTPQQIYFAELAAGDDNARTVAAVCERSGVTILKYPPPFGRFKVGDTMAVNTVRALVEKNGAMNARIVLQTIVAAKCAPVSSDHIKAAQELLLGRDYKGLVKDAQITDALRAWGGEPPPEAIQFAAARKVPLWRALVVIIANRKTRHGSSAAA